jgi:hypothetical protein
MPRPGWRFTACAYHIIRRPLAVEARPALLELLQRVAALALRVLLAEIARALALNPLDEQVGEVRDHGASDDALLDALLQPAPRRLRLLARHRRVGHTGRLPAHLPVRGQRK